MRRCSLTLRQKDPERSAMGRKERGFFVAEAISGYRSPPRGEVRPGQERAVSAGGVHDGG